MRTVVAAAAAAAEQRLCERRCRLGLFLGLFMLLWGDVIWLIAQTTLYCLCSVAI